MRPREFEDISELEIHDTLPAPPMEERADGIRDSVYHEVMTTVMDDGDLDFETD